MFETNDAVTAEVLWTGEMAVDAGSLKKGQLLTAHCCFVFEFKDGKSSGSEIMTAMNLLNMTRHTW